MKLRAKGKHMKEALQLHDWKFNFDAGGFGIQKKDIDNSYRLYFRDLDENQKVNMMVHQCCHPLEFIYSKFFDGNMDEIYFGSERASVTPIAHIHDTDELTVHTWKKQWFEEVLPKLELFKDLSNILDEDNNTQDHSQLFSGNNKAKRLILRKLVSESEYQIYKTRVVERYIELLEDKSNEHYNYFLDASDRINKLINYLDGLNCKQYLSEHLWRDQIVNKVDDIEDPVVLDRIGMIVIGEKISPTEVAELLSMTQDLKNEEMSVAESMIMEFSTDHVFDLLESIPKATIAFIQAPQMYDEFNIISASKGTKAMRFMMDEGASMSYSISYAIDGNLLLDYAEGNGEIFINESTEDFDLRDNEPLKMIEKIFEQVANMSIYTIKQTNQTTRYIEEKRS